MSLPVSAHYRIAIKPERLSEPEVSRSSGKWVIPQTYVVGWPDGIVKVGCTSHGRKRWGSFLARGGRMLDIGYYAGADCVYAEIWLQERLAEHFPPAFASKEDAEPYLGSKGAGYLECYRIPVSDWRDLVEWVRCPSALV